MDESIEIIKLKLQRLEYRITSLRLGRRILMDLLIEQENTKDHEIKRLKRIIKYNR